MIKDRARKTEIEEVTTKVISGYSLKLTEPEAEMLVSLLKGQGVNHPLYMVYAMLFNAGARERFSAIREDGEPVGKFKFERSTE